MTKRDQQREVSRRALIKWSLAAGAALGVSRATVLEVLEKAGGKHVVEAAAATPNKRSVHIRGGTGGIAWYQLMWPHNDVAAAHRAAGSWPFAAAQTTTITGNGGTLTRGPQTPWASLDAAHQVTAVMAGTNEIHNANPNAVVRSLTTGSLFAIASVLQADIPSVVPVIAVGNVDFGNGPGAPLPAGALTADAIVGLFNSAASQAGGLLAISGHADLYRAQYETLATLNRASTLSTTRAAYHTGRASAKFLGTNLASKLAYRTNASRTGPDDVLYGMAAGSPFDSISNNNNDTGGPRRDQLANFGKSLAAAAKAFELGLAASIVLPSIEDDPHGAFQANALTTDAAATLATMKTMLDGFMTDLAARRDSVTNEPLANNVVITIEGDTPKDPNTNSGWPDQTPGQSNWIYILGGGRLKSGWFGGVDRSGGVQGFNPATGAAIASPNGAAQAAQAQAAVAATAYAITNGDIRRVQDFTSLDISALIV